MGSRGIPDPTTPNALQQLRDLRSELRSEKALDEETRRGLHNEARALVWDLETEGDILTRTLWGPWETITLATALDMGLLETLAANTEPLSAKKLAAACNAETLLTERLLRCLSSYGAVDTTTSHGEARFSATKVSRVYATARGITHMRFVFGILWQGWLRAPAKFKANDYCSLTTGTHTVYSDLHGKPEATIWELFSPEEAQESNIFMPTFNIEHRNWLDVYPAEERLIKGAKNDEDAVLIVDVGGNNGSQAGDLRRRFPDAPGRVIVQDLAQALQNVAEGVEAIAHDFFTPQPIKGARAYYLRYIMHDWGHDDNVKILTNLRQAMEPGYSKVLINEWVLPDKGASPLMTSQDLNMMTASGGEERPEYRHRAYIEAAGLKITGIWDLKDGTTEAVIECELA